jgi:D-xylose transport system substrate-binding protein
MAGGVISALQSAGLAGKVFVSGTDGDITAIKRILDGTQSMTVMVDLEEETRIASDMAMKFATGQKEQIQFTDTYDNGKMDIPRLLYNPINITKDNIQEEIINAGIFTMEQIQNAGK